MELSDALIRKIKKDYKPGTRVRCKYMDDPYHPVQPNTEGTVVKVDDGGTIHVHWDNGSFIGLIPGVDIFEKSKDSIVMKLKEIER